MPNCFQLISKETKEPELLQKIDTDLWIRFNGSEPEGNSKWFMNWYNTLGLLMSIGKTWEDLREIYPEPFETEVINYLAEKYDISSWYSHIK